MGLLFDRKVELHLFTSTDEVIFVNDYDISFEVFSTSASEPNTAKITIHGLSEDQRSLFGPDLTYLELWAGYEDDYGMIFRGSWDERDTKKKSGSKATHTKLGPTWQTDIVTGDGLKEVQLAFFNRSYPAGTLLSKVMMDIFDTFGLPVLFEFSRVETFLHAATFTGRASKILDDLAWSFKFDWSVQHGSVIVTERDEPSQTLGLATVLSHSSGLVGNPIVTADGIECKTMMLHTIKPKGLVEITDQEVPGEIENLASRVKGKKAKGLRSEISNAGIYVVDEITYYGNNRGGEYNCTVKALFG